MSEIERLADEAKQLLSDIAGIYAAQAKEFRHSRMADAIAMTARHAAIIDALAAAKVAGASSAEPLGEDVLMYQTNSGCNVSKDGGRSWVRTWRKSGHPNGWISPTPSAESSAEQIGRDARMRAAGMSALLGEVMAQNARRDLDDDLVDRIERAIADQEAATSSAAPAPSDPQAKQS